MKTIDYFVDSIDRYLEHFLSFYQMMVFKNLAILLMGGILFGTAAKVFNLFIWYKTQPRYKDIDDKHLIAVRFSIEGKSGIYAKRPKTMSDMILLDYAMIYAYFHPKQSEIFTTNAKKTRMITYIIGAILLLIGLYGFVQIFTIETPQEFVR